MVLAAANSHSSRVDISKCFSFTAGKGSVVWVASAAGLFFGNGEFPLMLRRDLIYTDVTPTGLC